MDMERLLSVSTNILILSKIRIDGRLWAVFDVNISHDVFGAV